MTSSVGQGCLIVLFIFSKNSFLEGMNFGIGLAKGNRAKNGGFGSGSLNGWFKGHNGGNNGTYCSSWEIISNMRLWHSLSKSINQWK